MRFISFTAMSNRGLDKKVNEFLMANPQIEIIRIKFAASFGNIYAAIIYK